MPKLTVDGVEIEVPNGATVLQACELAGKAQLACGLGGPGFTSTRHIRQLPAIDSRS